jgi:hypothetical protein
MRIHGRNESVPWSWGTFLAQHNFKRNNILHVYTNRLRKQPCYPPTLPTSFKRILTYAEALVEWQPFGHLLMRSQQTLPAATGVFKKPQQWVFTHHLFRARSVTQKWCVIHVCVYHQTVILVCVYIQSYVQSQACVHSSSVLCWYSGIKTYVREISTGDHLHFLSLLIMTSVLSTFSQTHRYQVPFFNRESCSRLTACQITGNLDTRYSSERALGI